MINAEGSGRLIWSTWTLLVPIFGVALNGMAANDISYRRLNKLLANNGYDSLELSRLDGNYKGNASYANVEAAILRGQVPLEVVWRTCA